MDKNAGISTRDTGNGSDLSAYNGAWGSNEIIHLLKRTMFGAKKVDLDHFKSKSLAQTVDELLTPLPFKNDPPINDYDTVGNFAVPLGKTWLNVPYNEKEDGYRVVSFRKWTMQVFLNQDRSIREKMLLFWHNHFATQVNVGRSNTIWNHHSLLRSDALGNFKELTRKITLDCHMLQYLNGEENTKLAPNENYARELQELFCIGKGPAARFTEDDVKQAAKVLTGWKVNPDAGISYFKEDDHDSSDKTFSSFYNNTVIKGRSGPGAGELELTDLLNMLFSNKETALFICRRLYRWFVNHTIDEATEKNIIVPLAAILEKNKFEIKPVLKALLSSNHFFDPAIYGAQIKSPIDFCIGLQREFNVEYAPQESFFVNYSMLTFLLEFCGQMGQGYSDPPNVSGWPAYYQAPGFYEAWINTFTYPKRNEFSTTFVDYGFNREGHFFSVDVHAFARSFDRPGDPDALISDSLELLYRVPVSEESKKTLKINTLLSGQSQDHYWTEAWDEYIKNPEDAVAKNTVETRLKNLYRYIVSSPEYQLA